MLERCRRDQWSIADLDWNVAPPALSREREELVVQAFTDMAGIELLAGALFAVERDQCEDPILRAIFASFVVDEERHAAVATRLAAHYNVHHYREYIVSPALTRFRPHFLNLVKNVSADLANAYITAGELILDVALLRSLDDFVADDMSHRAMQLINRDESRHIAIDFHMTEHYCSDAHLAVVAARPRLSLRTLAFNIRAGATMMWHARPFLQDVFLRPMEITDPEGKRTHEAFKRIQLVLRKPTVARMPFARFMIGVQRAYNHPVTGRLFGPLLLRALGAEPRVAKILFTDEELARSHRMSFEEMARDAC